MVCFRTSVTWEAVCSSFIKKKKLSVKPGQTVFSNVHFACQTLEAKPLPFTKFLFSGELDDIPEVAFYMVGSIEDVLAAADKLAQQQQ